MPTETRSLWSTVHTPSGGGGNKAAYDVCVAGAGIAGLTTAYHLLKAGRSVLVLDAQDRVAQGETLFTTAHLSSILDDRFSRLQSIRGLDAAKLAYQSHSAAIDAIERTAADENIDCDFLRVDGFLFPGEGQKPDELDDEEKAAREAGVTLERLARPPAAGLGAVPCLRFPRQGQFHPIKYLKGLAEAVQKLGGTIKTGTRVSQVEGGPPAKVTLQDGKAVTAAAVVVATNTPLNSGVVLNSKLAAYTTYAFAAEVPAGAVPAGLYWDMLDPYHYVRTQRLTTPRGPVDYLIVGGEDHKTGQADDQAARWGRLEAWARPRFPAMKAVEYRWSGQVFETLDGLALIGPEPGGTENVLIATGDSGMGMTHGTLAGLLLTDLIQKRPNPWAELYDPRRTPVAAAKTFVEENVNMAAQYRDWLTAGDVRTAEDVKPGTGATIRRGLTKVAVYCERNGTRHELTAVCPHLGGLVRWNDGEGTWDCPCHGSRFSPEGKVLHGPAVDDLKAVKV